MVIIKSTPVIFLYVVNLMIFGLIARALFYDVDEINPEKRNEHYLWNFQTYSQTLFTLFILSTLDNYPDCILGMLMV